MDDLVTELERAVALQAEGRVEQALRLLEGLMARARSSAHAAPAFRHTAECLQALGQYAAARELAQEAGALARASRHPGEILAASLLLLEADLYEGQVAAVHRQLGDLLELAPEQAECVLLMGRLLAQVGDFEQAAEQFERGLDLLKAIAPPGADPGVDARRARTLLHAARTELARGAPRAAAARAESALLLGGSSPVIQALGRAELGLALARDGQPEPGQASLEAGLVLSHPVGGWLHGQVLALAGALARERARLDQAEESLRASLEFTPHALERQEACCLLGELSLARGERMEAQAWYRQATQPSVETHFGRQAVRRLHALLGLRPL